MSTPAVRHRRLAELPRWPGKTVAMLATAGEHPHIIPVSAPVRAGARTILISLHRTRGSLKRLREHPGVALLLLAADDIAFTAHGRARVIEEPMGVDDRYAAIEISVESIDDHRQADFHVTAGIDREWDSTAEQATLRDRVHALSARAHRVDAHA